MFKKYDDLARQDDKEIEKRTMHKPTGRKLYYFVKLIQMYSTNLLSSLQLTLGCNCWSFFTRISILQAILEGV